MRIILLIILNIFIWAPVSVSAQPRSTLNPQGAGAQTGVISGVGSPTDTGEISDEGTVPEEGKPSLVPFKTLSAKRLSGPQAIEMSGVGDNCSAGAKAPEFWHLDPEATIDTREELQQMIAVAINSDKRLRRVHVDDDAIDMYYLQPAYRWGFVPMNYYLHITANGKTLHMSLEKPEWIGSSKNYHSQVTNSFADNAPSLLNSEVVAALDKNELIARNAKMIEVVSAIMYKADVRPISNSFFVCYVLPFILYIFFAILILAIFIWFVVKRMGRKSGFEIHKARHNDDEEDSPMFPGVH